MQVRTISATIVAFALGATALSATVSPNEANRIL